MPGQLRLGAARGPNRFPEWNKDTIAVTGAPTKIEKGSTFAITGKGRWVTPTTTFVVDELDDLRESSSAARGAASTRIGSSPRLRARPTPSGVRVERIPGLDGLITGDAHKGYLRRTAESAVDSLRRALTPAERK
jgi:hypothetical protein